MISHINSYEEAEEYILQIPKFTKKNSLASTKQFYEKLGSPAKQIKTIHVAGTNGKGSVCSYLNGILSEAGYSVGLFTSPHLVSMRERIRISGALATKEEFLEAFSYVMEKVEKPQSGESYHPTFFEILFFIAMLIFEKKNLDYLILETGLGGRLDTTNIVEKPVVTILTEIGLDHMEYLGDTLEQIAYEKAGIIKPEVPVVYWKKEQEVTNVIEKVALEQRTKAFSVEIDRCKNCEMQNKSIAFSLKSRYYDYIRLILPTIALYQVENVSLAIAALEIMDEGRTITKEQIEKAVSSTKWEGRMEEIAPNVYVDGAHNPDGIKAFTETIQATGRKDNILLFSAVKDKDYEKMVQMLMEEELFSYIAVTQIEGERGTQAEKLKEVFLKYTNRAVHSFETPEEAYQSCIYEKKGEEKLYIVGSLYLVGMVKGKQQTANTADGSSI